MKRKQGRRWTHNPPTKIKNKNWPIIYCETEDTVIAISYYKIGYKGDKFGNIKLRELMSEKHWRPKNCAFRTVEHIIDMSQYKKGDEIRCPKCKGLVDFRVFPSATKPKFA